MHVFRVVALLASARRELEEALERGIGNPNRTRRAVNPFSRPCGINALTHGAHTLCVFELVKERRWEVNV